jgi:hypothetical protein
MMDCVKSPCRSARVAPALVIITITMIVQLCSFRLRLRRIISISLCEGDGRGIDVYWLLIVLAAPRCSSLHCHCDNSNYPPSLLLTLPPLGGPRHRTTSPRVFVRCCRIQARLSPWLVAAVCLNFVSALVLLLVIVDNGGGAGGDRCIIIDETLAYWGEWY